ncbi:MAG: 3-phosphoglycerate dehydrogenase [Halomonadaceae bacterium]|nr:MAG: 3-phosphoglycerate dehydrogenase [Halomonadaceae bacterium]
MNPAGHQTLVIAFAVAATVVALLLPELSIATQFWVILVPVALFGLSHGGADPLILKTLTRVQKGPRLWLAMGLYSGLAVAFILLIWWSPVLALGCFLLLSLWHFGRTDVTAFSGEEQAGPAPAQWGRVWLAGGLPIIGPVTGHPQQTGELFAWLLGMEPVPVIAFTLTLGPWLAGLWLVGFVGLLAGYRRRLGWPVYLELLSLAAAMVLLPPLLAFTFYFCGVHSVRHFMAVARHTPREDHAGTLGFLARQAAPATLAAIIMAAMAWGLIVTLAPATDLMVEAVRILFWGLAALTVPHVLAVEWWWSRGTTKA